MQTKENSKTKALRFPLEDNITPAKIQAYVNLGGDLRTEFLREAFVLSRGFFGGLFHRTQTVS